MVTSTEKSLFYKKGLNLNYLAVLHICSKASRVRKVFTLLLGNFTTGAHEIS